MDIFQKLPGALLPWYDANKRDLPWRQDQEPYHIWVSEIMLQQTRVEAVKGYYARFLTALPTIEALASCGDDRLSKLWEGLGYYSRVRNLKKAAQVIMSQYAGAFPQEYAAVRALPGIGDYTAGAVCSIAFNQKTPAVDGNVLRVVARLTADPTPVDQPAFKITVRERLAEIYPDRAGDFTQALMELGATVCGPNTTPVCEKCPCGAFCLANAQGRQQEFPVRAPKKGKKEEKLTLAILHCDGRYALEKRPDKGLLAGLWQFPNVPGHLDAAGVLAQLERWGVKPTDILRQTERSHIFTHIRWQMRGFYAEVKEPAGNFTWMTADEIVNNAALPTAFRQFWEEIDHV